MALTQRETTAIALNVTRTRVTVLAFNLTIISVMLSLKATSGEFTLHDAVLSASAEHRRLVRRLLRYPLGTVVVVGVAEPERTGIE